MDRLSLQDVRFLHVYDNGNSNSTRVYLFTSLSILIYEHEMSFQNFSISSPHSWLQYSAFPQTVGALFSTHFLVQNTRGLIAVNSKVSYAINSWNRP
jgi:hypothetical protein